MRSLSIALALLATPAAAQAPEPGLAPPDWLRKPSGDEMHNAWPYEAYRRGIDGRAVLDCMVGLSGALEGCKVTSEDPPGMGFGAGALMLVPLFVMKPATKDGKPVRYPVNIPIRFAFPEGTGMPEVSSRVLMISDPAWQAAPSFADLAAAWPSGAKAEVGHVSMQCRVTPDGGLAGCEVLTESPQGQGFGRAARGLAPKFRLLAAPEDLKGPRKLYVNVPIHFAEPSKPAPRAVTRPRWIRSIDPEKVVQIFPEQAIAAGVRNGRGVAECVVALDGRLTECKPAPATPPDLGFSEAAVKIASVMQMSVWTDGGGPVDGVRLKLPVTFNLAPEAQAAAAKP